MPAKARKIVAYTGISLVSLYVLAFLIFHSVYYESKAEFEKRQYVMLNSTSDITPDDKPHLEDAARKIPGFRSMVINEKSNYVFIQLNYPEQASDNPHNTVCSQLNAETSLGFYVPDKIAKPDPKKACPYTSFMNSVKPWFTWYRNIL